MQNEELIQQQNSTQVELVSQITKIAMSLGFLETSPAAQISPSNQKTRDDTTEEVKNDQIP